MTNGQQWTLAGVVIIAVVGGLIWFFAATKPDCLEYSETKWTRQGWYCVVPPLPKGRM